MVAVSQAPSPELSLDSPYLVVKYVADGHVMNYKVYGTAEEV